MTDSIWILTVINPENQYPHEYSGRYDGTAWGLKQEIETACNELGLDVAEEDINTIQDELLQEGIYWLDETYCFEKFSV